MTTKPILVLGGTGFVGRHILARLNSLQLRTLVPTRRRDRARHLLPLPTNEIVEADIHDDATLHGLVAQSEAVINLVGILHGSGADFERAHVTLPTRIIDACRQHQVRRLLHMSALGVTDTGKMPSLYLQSKQAGEAAMRASGLDWTIFRPSVIFGPDDRFINLFASLQRFVPLVPLAGADARLQPVYIGDVTSAFVNVLHNPASVGRTYELAGPDVYRLRELVALAGRIHGCQRLVIGLPDWLGRLQAAVMEVLPGPRLMSMDNLDSLRQPNVASGPMAPELGITSPTRLDAASATGSLARQQRLDHSRAGARRHPTQ